MDVHVRRAISVALRQRGVDVLTAQEDESATLPDSALLDRATVLRRMLFSQDEDLLAEATRRQKRGIAFGGVVYAHQLYVTVGTCISDLETIAVVGNAEDLADQVQFLPL